MRYYGIPGIGIPHTTGFNFIEPPEDQAFMREDEYDALIDDPTGFLYNVWLPRISTEVAAIVNVFDETREIVRVYAVVRGRRLPLEIPLLPDLPPTPAQEFRIADGKTYSVFQRAIEKEDLSLGEGNGDGRASAGETIAILLPDAGAYRAAELFTSDACVDNTLRASDSWSAYDHVGASAKYSLPAIKRGCPAGHVIHFMARMQLPDKPNHKLRYAAVDVVVK